MDHSRTVADEYEAMVRTEDEVTLGSAEADQGQKSWIRPRHWNDCVGGAPFEMTMKTETKTRRRTLQQAGTGQKDVRDEKSGRSW